MTSRTHLALLLALTAAALPMTAQHLPQGTEDPVVKALRRLLNVEPSAPPGEFSARATAVAAAMGDRPQAEAIRSATGMLASISGWGGITPEQADALTQAIKEHRNHPSPELLLPIILMLERVAGDRLELLLTLAETFGATSCIRDVDRARNALRRLVDLLPEDFDAFDRSGDQVRAFLKFLGMEDAGWSGVRALRAYLGLLEKDGGTIALVPRLGAEDILALRLIENLVEARRRGNQAASVDLLEQLRKLQPQNSAYQLLLAETFASVGPAWNYEKARECLQQFLAGTDPDATESLARGRWAGFAHLRITLEMLEWGSLPGQPGRNAPTERLRAYATELLPRIKTPIVDRLAISPDADELEKLSKLLRRREEEHDKDHAKKKDAFERAQERCNRAEQAFRSAGSESRQFQQRRSDLYASWMDAKRALERSQAALKSAADRLAQNQQRLKAYEDRLQRFDR